MSLLFISNPKVNQPQLSMLLTCGHRGINIFLSFVLSLCVQRVDEYQEAEHDQHPREVHILAGHSDIIRIIARLDNKRYIKVHEQICVVMTVM